MRSLRISQTALLCRFVISAWMCCSQHALYMHWQCKKRVTMLQQKRPLSCEVFKDMDLKMISTRK